MSGSETWDQNDTGNLAWTSSQHPNSDYFAALDNVRFDATASPGNQTVNLSGTLQPSSVFVTGAKSYTFAGFGQITGVAALTVAGPGSLTIQNGNDSYTGGTNIQGGSIILGVPNGLPTAGTVTFGAAATGGTLDLAGNNQTVGGLAVAPGASPRSKSLPQHRIGNLPTPPRDHRPSQARSPGPHPCEGILALEVSSGQLVLSGSNNIYVGGTTVNGGTLQLGVTSCAAHGWQHHGGVWRFRSRRERANYLRHRELPGSDRAERHAHQHRRGLRRPGRYGRREPCRPRRAGQVGRRSASPQQLEQQLCGRN